MVIINPKLINLIQCWRIPKVFNHYVLKKSSSKIYIKKWLYNPWSGPNPKTCCFGPSHLLRCGHHGHTSPPGPTPQAAVEGHRVTTQAPSLHGYVAVDGSPAKKWGDHGMHGDSTNVNQFFGDFTEHPSGFPYLTKPPDHVQYPQWRISKLIEPILY